MKKIKKQLGYVLQETSQRVVIATMNSVNEKTGNMVQLWILAKNVDPVDLKSSKKDALICGNCPLKSGGGCYVNVGQAPKSVYKSYKAGKYSNNYGEFLEVVKSRKVRFGAYGDPSFINISIVKDIANNALGYTGYTHQWMNRSFDTEYLNYFMASVDNVNQLKLLKAKSPTAKYFRIVDTINDLKSDEIICPNETTGIECRDCGLCDGLNVNVCVTKHGSQKNKVVTK